MSTRHLCQAALLGAAVLIGSRGSHAQGSDTDKPAEKGGDGDLARAEKALKAHLKKIKAKDAEVNPVKYEAIQRSLPGHHFFGVLFRQHPVPRMPPKGFKPSNVCVVKPDGNLEFFTSARELEKFFKMRLPPAKTDAQYKDAVRSWLRVAQELYQDGFYKFTLMDEATSVIPIKAGKIVTGKVVVMAGGNGVLSARIIFNKAGKITKVSEDSKIVQGVRPECQATLLLDPDPLVRKIAEQNLLIMGRFAKPYLDEQRAKASPELRRAIDRVWKRILDEDR
jgi:hypothetical protein